MRGFVTIATGSEQYYILARNLLHSYMNHSKPGGHRPFGIICDRENSYTAEFDDVVLVDHPHNSYLDKLMLYKYSPYDETIFVDADSLFFRDPESMWEDFSDQDDVSCYGVALPLDSKKAWFTYEGSGKYKDNIQYLINLHGGAYYFRKTERAGEIFELAISLASEYDQYEFRNFDQPADEPVMAMAMAICGCRPCEKTSVGGGILFVPSYRRKLKINRTGELLLSGRIRDEALCHFATSNTKLFIYRYAEYLSESKFAGTKVRPMADRIRIRFETAPAGYRDTMRHLLGRFARKFLSEGMVTKLKGK